MFSYSFLVKIFLTMTGSASKWICGSQQPSVLLQWLNTGVDFGQN